MIEIQCTSCHTRYRIDQRVLPDDTPTFKCSRCGHVFRAEPRRNPAAAKPNPNDEPATAREEDAAAKAAPQSREDARTEQGESEPIDSGPLDRTFDDRIEEPKAGENLTFDFNEEPPAQDDGAPLMEQPEEVDEWEVGDNPMRFDAPAAGPSRLAADIPLRPVAPRIEPAASGLRGPLPSEVASMAERGRVHSAGLFIALFAAVVAGFGAIALLICGAPTASAALLSKLPGVGDRFVTEATAQSRVTIGGVQAEYRQLRENQVALVVTGRAENDSQQSLHAIQIGVTLLDHNGREAGSRAAYCGNSLSSKLIEQMTARELDFFGKLDPPRSFALDPGQASPFTLIFVNPPSTSRFRIAVIKAAPMESTAPRS